MMGGKGARAVLQVWSETHEINSCMALETGGLGGRRGGWQSMCSGKMRRYMEEHQWGRRRPGMLVALRHESVGSK